MKDKRIPAETHTAKNGQTGEREQEPALKGTFASVLLLAAFIVLLWTGVFLLFISRN